eukprot:scaffold1311_cov256-Pinguiococcus_pyrenoidosus.AAC.61
MPNLPLRVVPRYVSLDEAIDDVTDPMDAVELGFVTLRVLQGRRLALGQRSQRRFAFRVLAHAGTHERTHVPLSRIKTWRAALSRASACRSRGCFWSAAQIRRLRRKVPQEHVLANALHVRHPHRRTVVQLLLMLLLGLEMPGRSALRRHLLGGQLLILGRLAQAEVLRGGKELSRLAVRTRRIVRRVASLPEVQQRTVKRMLQGRGRCRGRGAACRPPVLLPPLPPVLVSVSRYCEDTSSGSVMPRKASQRRGAWWLVGYSPRGFCEACASTPGTSSMDA